MALELVHREEREVVVGDAVYVVDEDGDGAIVGACEAGDVAFD